MMNAGLLKMGETGRGEAELARCANQGIEQVSRFLEAQSEGSKNHSTIMAEIIFSMNPETQASLYRLRAAGEDYPQNSMDALVLDFKDDEIIRLICNVYRGGLRSPEMLARVAKQVLPTKERKKRIVPDLGQELMGSGMEKATWEAVKDEILWDVYSLSEKIDRLVSRSRFGKADLERVKELSSDLKGSKNRGEMRKILKYLVVALEGDNPEVRGLVADYLPSFYDTVRNSGQFRNADVLFLKKLIARLKRETEESVQNSILVSLASILKAEILQDRFHAPARAVITLSRMGYLLRLIQTSDSLVSQEVTDHVIAALAGQDQVRRNEASILLKLSGRAVLESVLFALEREENPETRERLMVVVRSMGTEITGEIIHRLADGRWFVVQTALQILGEIGDRTVSSDLLISSVYHDDIRVRKEAIQTLGKLRSRGAIRMLCDLLTDKDEEIRFLALRTLGDTGDKMAVPHILPFLQKKRKVKGQKSEILRQTAIEVLGRIGDPEAIPILLDLLRSKAVSKKGGEVIRKRLVEALGAIRDPELEEVFQSVMEKDTDVAVREAARRAILNLESPERRAAL
jgi:HEAT repeat protein